jgi:ADP-Ribosyltransferase in polyvalent proteins
VILTTHQSSLSSWLNGSAFMRDGAPTVWYHGTDVTEDFNIFTSWGESSIGFHFGSAPTASARLSTTRLPGDPDDHEACRLIPVYCRAQRPLRLKDHHCWRLDRVAAELADLGLVGAVIEDHIVDGCDEFAVFAAVEAAGFDSVIYANETESEGRLDDSLLIWRPELVKSVFASKFNPDDPRILPERPARSRDTQRWQENRDLLNEAARRLKEISPAIASPVP